MHTHVNSNLKAITKGKTNLPISDNIGIYIHSPTFMNSFFKKEGNFC